MDIFSINSSVFGHSGFRDGQLFLISSILEGRDCLGIMPTGGGKSLCYQIPALALQGLTLVVSPLISLMNDQVAALRLSGVPADAINSSLSYSELKTAQANVKSGRCRLLYVSPERLEAPAFLELVKDVRIPLIAVDEAHCISQWGQDFRPSYLGISDFVRKLPERPVVAAFTATATAEVRDDIIRLFRLRQMNDYCVANTCYRGFILDYFGQEHEPGCGNCGNCLAVCDSVDITTEAQMVLSCVKRIHGALGYNVGSQLLVQVLTGSRSQRILDLGLDRLSTYGLLHSLNGAQVKEYIELLMERGYLSRSVEHGALSATDKAAGVLFRGERVTVGLRRRPAPKPARRKRGSGEEAKAAEPQSEAHELFNELRSVRTRLAREQGIPPFMVFSDAVLWDMVLLRPQTAKDFLCVSGVGEYKAKKYGAVFLEALREHGQSGSE